MKTLGRTCARLLDSSFSSHSLGFWELLLAPCTAESTEAACSGHQVDLKQSGLDAKLLRTVQVLSRALGTVTWLVGWAPRSQHPASLGPGSYGKKEEESKASPSQEGPFQGLLGSPPTPAASGGEAVWSWNKAPVRAADGASGPGTQRGWLCGPGPTKASLSHRRPPAEAEVAVAPGACHLMTVLAGPDVPQTSAAPSRARPASRHRRGHSNSN